MSERKYPTWEQRYLLGRWTLLEAMTQYMLEGKPVPARLVEAFLAAQMRYQSPDGSVGNIGDRQRIDDFAEPLGIAMTQREKRELARRLEVMQVRRLVDSIREGTGKPMTNPSAFEDTAFHEAGKKLHMSPSHVHDIYYKGVE